jgi:hypothetical protein
MTVLTAASAAAASTKGAMVPIAFLAIGGTNKDAGFSITSIPQGYQDLRVVMHCRSTGALETFGIYGYFNNDVGGANNYSSTFLYTDGSSSLTTNSSPRGDLPFGESVGANATTKGMYSVLTIDILNYSNTSVKKTILGRHYAEQNKNTFGLMYYTATMWQVTSAITSLTIGTSGYQLLDVGSYIEVFGIRSAGQ